MTIFELVFFIIIICPVITNHIRVLLDVYKTNNPIQYNFNPNPTTIINVLNLREYQLIDNFNLNNYFIIIIFIILLITLLFYFYHKIKIIENSLQKEDSPQVSPNNSQRSNASEYTITERTNSVLTRSGHGNKINFIYLKHAIVCAISTIICLIIYQIFFYFYGLEFKYVGTENEFIVLFIQSIY